MNKKLLELLDSINEKKALVKNLVDEGKIEEAKTAKNELKELQDKFDILKDMDDIEPAPKNPKPVKPVVENDAVKKFLNAARCGFKNIMTSTEKQDGGYTVPEDLDYEIHQFKDAAFNLESLVTVENVSNPSGSRVFQKKGHAIGFGEVDENGKIQATDKPEFTTISYKVKKYAGYLPVTSELLDDSDAAIRSVITKWLGDGSRVTGNKGILSLKTLDLTHCSSVPSLTAAWYGTPDDLQILVPAALADEWKQATNWVKYADKIIGV